MSDCIFCKIAKGEIPTHTLYEDEDFRIILDLGPATNGHALILPKAHAANIYQLPDELVAKAFILSKKLMSILKDILQCDGYNIVQNNGEAAGQTVFHFHIHLIPRYKDNQRGMISWVPGKLQESEAKELVEKVRNLV